MNNQEVNEYMHRYLDNDLSGDELELLKEHLRHFPADAVMFERLKQLNSDLEQLPRVSPPISLVDAILPRLDREDLWEDEKVTGIGTDGGAREGFGLSSVATPGGKRSGKPGWDRTTYRWLGGVVAAGIALTVFITTIGPGTTSNDSADSLAMEKFDTMESDRSKTLAADSGAGSMAFGSVADDAVSTESDQGNALGASQDRFGIMAVDPDTPVSDKGISDMDVSRVEVTSGTDANHKVSPSSTGHPESAEIVQNAAASSTDVPVPVLSPDHHAKAVIVKIEDEGWQLHVTDESNNVIVHSDVYLGQPRNLVWSDDSAVLKFDIEQGNAVKLLQVDMRLRSVHERTE